MIASTSPETLPQCLLRVATMISMRLLIDGYNLLHATDVFGSGPAAGTLQGSREALLAVLARLLSASERRHASIVFDAAGAPPGLPKVVHYDHITLQYARGYADADAMIEELIEQHPAPRGLLVVSSDHRVQRAARSRGAQYVDSNLWYRDLVGRRAKSSSKSTTKPPPGGSIDYWVGEFATAEIDELERELRGTKSPRLQSKTTKRRPHAPPNVEGELENPFPPGYGEDLLDEL